MQKQFVMDSMADEKLQEMLALYKSPATIRDLKQVYFYVTADANVTQINPLQMRFNVPMGLIGDPEVNMYYGPLGTTRQFNIMDKINDLLDIRVPKDKYVIEINLAECVIEGDASGWSQIPDKIIAKEGANWVVGPTYRKSIGLSGPGTETPPLNNFFTGYDQATKQSEPQTLYVRIRELNNGEPFNWSVTNSGSYSIDKSHQLLVRLGDIDVSNLTLEFGHLVFEGDDNSYEQVLSDPSTNTDLYYTQSIDRQGVNRTDKLNTDKMYYRQARYFDYNQESYNTVTSNEPLDPWYDANIANFYKGYDGIDYAKGGNAYNSGTDFKSVPGYNFTQPSNRPPYMVQSGSPNDYYLQGKPYLYNQQVSKLGFRFQIKVISLF